MSRTWHHAPWRVRASHPTGSPKGIPFGKPIYYTARPTPELRHLVWWRPDRAHARSTLRQAVAEWNTTGDTGLEPEPRQHRHSNSTGGGWWD